MAISFLSVKNLSIVVAGFVVLQAIGTRACQPSIGISCQQSTVFSLTQTAHEVGGLKNRFKSLFNNLGKKDYSRFSVIVSEKRENGTPISSGALSGLAVDQYHDGLAYSIHDNNYQRSRIYTLDTSSHPALIRSETEIYDGLGKLAAAEPFLVNSDRSVNLDAEGIALREDGGFWIASEGDDKPTLFRNLLLQVDKSGLIRKVVSLPHQTAVKSNRFGFEGVTSIGSGKNEFLFVAFQREWRDDPQNHVRIGRYQVATGDWTYFYYPLETPQSPKGGWVGLSEITALGQNEFAVIERDNQMGADAAIKRLYRFSIDDLTPLPDTLPGVTPDFPLVSKTMIRDLIPDLKASSGSVHEKIEGMAVGNQGDLFVVNDNDGLENLNGNTQLLKVALIN